MKETLTLLRPDGTPITNWEMWTRPKRNYHWKEGRSAMELAKAWFRHSELSPPKELLQLLHSSDRLTDLQLLRGNPEHKTSLPERGESRNHDLWLLGRTKREQVTICIEAKADEPFDNNTVSQELLSAKTRKESGVSTRVLERIDKLLNLFPSKDNRWDDVKYQLLTAICGTAIQAKQDDSSLGVFIVHEFRTSLTKPSKIAKNEKDFNAFIEVITGSHEPIITGRLYGSVVIGGVECLLGKVVS